MSKVADEFRRPSALIETPEIRGNKKPEHENIYVTREAGSVAEWLKRRTCNSEVPSSSPALTANWICSRYSPVQILGHACK